MLVGKPRDRKIVLEGKDGICLRTLHARKDAAQLCTMGNKEEWIQVNQNIVASVDAHTWAAISGTVIIGQLDIYTIIAGELGKYFQARSNDAVIEYKHLQPATVHKDVLFVFMQFYFAHLDAGLLYAQTNIYDDSACRLYESAGLMFQQNIMLSAHAASLYLMTRARFREQCKK